MRFHFVRTAKKIGECRKPKFLVLKRRWLTLGAAVLAAAGVFAAVNYPAAVLKGEKEEAARAFLAYLETDAAMTVFERVGFSAVY